MLASFRALHRQPMATIFTAIVPTMYMQAQPTTPLSGGTVTQKACFPADDKSDVFMHDSPAPPIVSCLCSPNTDQCSSKGCLCAQEGLWCGNTCKCKGYDGCANPVNQQMTLCAGQHLASPWCNSAPHASATLPELDCLIRLPCRCGTVLMRQLLCNYECLECGLQFYYSFCFQSVVSANTIWHCEKCGMCRDFREIHCVQCMTCSFGNAGGECQVCNRSDSEASHNSIGRFECVIC